MNQPRYVTSQADLDQVRAEGVDPSMQLVLCGPDRPRFVLTELVGCDVHVAGTAVLTLGGTARVNSISDSVFVALVGDQAGIGTVRRDVRVGLMDGDAHIDVLTDRVVVEELHGNADVARAEGWARITVMDGRSAVHQLADHARVAAARGRAQITDMIDDASIGALSDAAGVVSVAERARVTWLLGGGRLGTVGGDALVSSMSGGTITTLTGRARVTKMIGGRIDRVDQFARVDHVGSPATVGEVADSSVLDDVSPGCAKTIARIGDDARVYRKAPVGSAEWLERATYLRGWEWRRKLAEV